MLYVVDQTMPQGRRTIDGRDAREAGCLGVGVRVCKSRFGPGLGWANLNPLTTKGARLPVSYLISGGAWLTVAATLLRSNRPRWLFSRTWSQREVLHA
jgi:hypothetical protein